MSPFIEFDPIFNAASPFIDFYLPRRNLEVSPFIENITQHQNQQIVALSPCRGVALYAGPINETFLVIFKLCDDVNCVVF